MLTISIYKGVPFDNNYYNVLSFDSTLSKLQYLDAYKIDTIINIPRYDSKPNTITLKKLYEDANYIVINDDTATIDTKYYFIRGYSFTGSNAIEYELEVDIWTTYANTINFKNSLRIGGHTNLTLYDTRSITCVGGSANAIIKDTALLAPSTANYYLLAYVIVSNSFEVLCFKDTESNITRRLADLAVGKYNDGQADIQYKIIKAYLISGNNLNGLYEGQGITINGVNAIRTGIYGIGNMYVLGSGIYTLDARYKYYIGTQTNKIELPNNEDLLTARVSLLVSRAGGINIILSYGDNYIDLASDFEVPVYTDAYTEYINRNQNQLDIANKQRILSSSLGIATGAISATASGVGGNYVGVAGGIAGATSSASSLIFNSEKAKQRDLKLQPANISIGFQNGVINATEGVYIYRCTYDNQEDINASVNYYGYNFNKYEAINIRDNANDYNFRYYQFNNPVFTIEAGTDVHDMLYNIFSRGVRIWYDANNYLTSCNFKKD